MSEGDTGALILLGFLSWNILAFVGFKLWFRWRKSEKKRLRFFAWFGLIPTTTFFTYLAIMYWGIFGNRVLISKYRGEMLRFLAGVAMLWLMYEVIWFLGEKIFGLFQRQKSEQP